MINKNKAIFFLHGYRGDRNEFAFFKKIKRKQVDYFSFTYGERNKKREIQSVEEAYQDIEQKIGEYIKRIGRNYGKKYLMGYSIGAAVAIKLVASKKFCFDGLILLCVFNNREDLLKERGIKIKETENIIPENLIKKVDIPILFLHGVNDTSIELRRALLVFSKCKKGQMVILHDDHSLKKSKEELLRSVYSFISSLWAQSRGEVIEWTKHYS